MLSYKICKKLRDAGFPQTVKYGDICWKKGGKEKITVNEDLLHLVQPCVKIPTLSELIKECECGDWKFTLIKAQAGWHARTRHVVDVSGYKTPEEAVAKLYLKLNHGKN